MKDPIAAWEQFVGDFTHGEYTHEDLFEIDVSLTMRLEIDAQFDGLTRDETDRVLKADEGFRQSAVHTMEKIGLLKAYRELGADAPREHWWWHL